MLEQTPDVEFLDCLHLLPQEHWSLRGHAHDHYELIRIVRGRLHVRMGGRNVVASPGEMLIYTPGLSHRPHVEGPMLPEMIALWWRGGRGLAAIDGPDVRMDRQGRVHHQLAWILDLHPGTNPRDNRTISWLTRTVLSELARLKDPTSGDLAGQVRRYIRANLSCRITLEELAKHAGLSKYHFSRRIKELVGETPMRLLTRMRVEAARDLVVRTALPLEAVAERVGLADASHLSHVFRRWMGCTPGALRRGPLVAE
jgi:AraC-like DNA-binding protein